jgi:hypothetical protein
MKYTITLSVSLILCGCGSTWHLRKTQDSGILAYRGFWTSTGAGEAVDKAIGDHCGGPYETVAEGYNEQYRTGSMPITTNEYSSGTAYGNNGQSANYSGYTQKTNYVPITINNSYRTIEYSCAAHHEEKPLWSYWKSETSFISMTGARMNEDSPVLFASGNGACLCTLLATGDALDGSYEMTSCRPAKGYEKSECAMDHKGTFLISESKLRLCPSGAKACAYYK